MGQLKVNNLCKTYEVNNRETDVLVNVNFEIEEGEMVAIMGPSGSGKSTLLYTVSGMDYVTGGNVNFFGTELCSLSNKQISEVRLKQMGFVFQQMHMLKNLSIYDNIVLPAYEAYKDKNKRKEADEYALKLMEKLGIKEVANNDINEVSGGQLQRACICRSMINRPKIIFADEPTGALNRQSTDEVLEILNQINEEGISIMMVTHDLKVAAKCERILYIQDGNIKSEKYMGKYTKDQDKRAREKNLNEWLLELGW